MSTTKTSTSYRREPDLSPLAKIGQTIALAGLFIYVAFAPHSVAVSSIGIAVGTIGWSLRAIALRTFGLSKSKFDLIILLIVFWTVLSAILSVEPSISIPKLESLWCILIFYLTRAVVTRNTAILLVLILILSGVTGTLFSVFDLLRGRGVVVESIAPGSPFAQIDVRASDAIWRVDGHRVYSTGDINEILTSTPGPHTVSIISQGEHVERRGLTVTAATIHQPNPSGIFGTKASHRFRASGWTRHYETFAEILQLIAQLALGLGLAHLANHGLNRYAKMFLPLAALLVLGIVLTAMRTVVVAFVLGAILIAWRSLRARLKVVFTFALFFILAFGAVVVWQTRAENALTLADPSSTLRVQVARVGLSRILLHPILGHGMDSMKLHWTEWGFPGNDMIHLHSTPLQLAFDRGLPMLALWLWLVISFWLYVGRAERESRDLADTHQHGILLGILGGLTGLLLSSLVNYNFGDSEVAMLFWWLMGLAVVLSEVNKANQKEMTGAK